MSKAQQLKVEIVDDRFVISIGVGLVAFAVQKYGDWCPTDVDHKDNVRNHNWIDNLRPATDSQNACNRGPANGLKGASWNSRYAMWAAQLSVGHQHFWLGLHATEEAAHAAYRRAAKTLHGEFARFE